MRLPKPATLAFVGLAALLASVWLMSWQGRVDQASLSRDACLTSRQVRWDDVVTLEQQASSDLALAEVVPTKAVKVQLVDRAFRELDDAEVKRQSTKQTEIGRQVLCNQAFPKPSFIP